MCQGLDTGYHNQKNSGLVTGKAAHLCAINISVENNGDWIEVYNGHDTTSGSKVVKIKCLENRSVNYPIPHDVVCDRGIYVYCKASDTEWSIFYHNCE